MSEAKLLALMEQDFQAFITVGAKSFTVKLLGRRPTGTLEAFSASAGLGVFTQEGKDLLDRHNRYVDEPSAPMTFEFSEVTAFEDCRAPLGWRGLHIETRRGKTFTFYLKKSEIAVFKERYSASLRD